MIQRLGKYRILDTLGQGGMGTVYRAFDPVLDREVAVKVVSSSDGELSAAQKARLLREGKACAQLTHPNVVSIYDLGEDGDQFFIVMEMLEGQDLKRVIDAHTTVALAEKLDLIMQVCDGLHYAHQKGIVHRDVKPGNIFVLPSGQVKILDFGLARLATGEATLTQTGQVFGTIAYMAPERFRGVSNARGDVFAVGAVCYELLTGRRAFVAPTAEQLMEVIRTQPPPPLAGLPPALITTVEGALQKDPAARVADLGAMRAALERVRRRLLDEGETATRPVAQAVEPAPPAPVTPRARTATLVGRFATRFRRFRVAMSISVTVTVALALYLVNVGEYFSAGAPRGPAVVADTAAGARLDEQAADAGKSTRGAAGTPASDEDAQLPPRVVARPAPAPVTPERAGPSKTGETSRRDVTAPERDIAAKTEASRQREAPQKAAAAPPSRGRDVDRLEARVNGARRAAEQTAAAFWVPQLLAAARAKERLAAAALESSDPASAVALLGEAESEYRAAAERARAAADAEQKVSDFRVRVTESRATTIARRTEAVAAQAPRVARDDFEAAEAAHREADDLDRRGDFTAATRAYETAAAKYAQAVRRAAGGPLR